ncbi:LOW QUALITY PROTEIN: hypothetical protein OSB04_019694 [Centaurea solstitialis]|uniref:Integrase catalytic domain-containing protein n=1 Tax=Centaurea solstitialis TaxID=347529 RepID=A0AA38T2A5_9ASTR|nr:LOW QUALITY PROTEIN: hypothetical protein OSB04_019694 [Centaurea solstitialis]
MGRRGLGFSEYDNIPKSTLKTPLYKTFKFSKAKKSKESLHLASFKRRRKSMDSHSRTPLSMKNVSFQDYFKSFSPLVMKNSIPKKYMTQKEIGIFWFGYPETQALYAYIDSDPDKESFLSPDANDFYPKEVIEVSENSLTSDNDQGFCEENSEQDPCSLESESSSKISNFDTASESLNYEFTSSDQVIESNIIGKYSADNKIINIPIVTKELKKKSGDFAICPDFIDLCLNLRRIEKEKALQSGMTLSDASKVLKSKFTWLEKEKWPETNVSSISVIAGNSKKGSPQKKFKSKSFRNKEPRSDRESCMRMPNTRKGSKNKPFVPSFVKFNESFKFMSCNTKFCECFNITYQIIYTLHPVWSQIPKTKKKQHVSTWYVNSGCSRHMTGTLELLSEYITKEGSSVAFGGNQKGKVKRYGMVVKGEIKLCDNGLDVLFKIKFCIMYKCDTKIEVMRANRRGDLYLICFDTFQSKEEICLVSSIKNEELWLTRFCHLNFHTLEKLVKLNLVKGLPNIKFEKDHLCSTCEMGKLRRSSHKTKSDPSFNQPLQMLHVDLCRPISNGKKYILVLVDEFSRFTWVEFVKQKSQVPLVLTNLLKILQVLYGVQARVLRSDNGTKFKNSVIEEYLTSVGITHNFSAPRTPQQNGVVERKNRTLVEAARSMLNAFSLPLTFWVEAMYTACYTQNRSLVVKRFEKTPYQLLYNKRPNIKFFHVFGCKCYVLNDREPLGKFDPKGDDAIFIGYAWDSAAYRVYILRTKTMVIQDKFSEELKVQAEKSPNATISQNLEIHSPHRKHHNLKSFNRVNLLFHLNQLKSQLTQLLLQNNPCRNKNPYLNHSKRSPQLSTYLMQLNEPKIILNLKS